ncbi:Sec-independent protein translocase protein TatB [Skermanella mucosa]|uniref:Sec-independent protein translocase protein TatB n=1 Tax=Skermanella mucosa TaxID=1789672 RepID=UPI00192C0237|nr:Sec-independent protein translocase protein TatB [Skermanella mucosa]UEM18770.1 Sec-independent protein translocase protein TatB [Skermanella mucosa]
MLDIGWSELLVIMVVALLVIGPKDLPKVLKTVGIWVRKARMLTRDFQNSVDEMIREADLEDVRRQATELRNLNLTKEVENTIDPSGSLRNAFDPNITSSPSVTARPRAEDDSDPEAEADRAAHGEVRGTGTVQAAQLPATAAEPQLPAVPADQKIPEPAVVPGDTPDKRA